MPPPPPYDPVPDWLRSTRLRQRRADGKPWTQDDLIERMKAEIGWAPHRPNYSKYETGKSKPEDTLPRFVEFWTKLGEPGPDYAPPRVELPKDAVAIAIEALTVELRQWRQEDRARIADLEKAVAALVTGRPAGELVESQEQLARQASAGSSR